MLQNFSILFFNKLNIFNDAPQPWQIGFQDSAAPGFTGIVELHNTIFFYLPYNFIKRYSVNFFNYI